MDEKETEALKSNKQQQQMLDSILREVSKQAKAEFPVYLKLIQADVMKMVLENMKREGNTDKIPQLTLAVDALLKENGKRLEELIENQFQEQIKNLCK